MKKPRILLIFLFLLFLIVDSYNTSAQTSGTLNFSVKITEPTGGYNNKLVLAIWLEDSATGNFIKTKMRYAQDRVQYLNVWIAKSGQNVVDAITGATTAPGTFSIIWNATNVSGTVVPDGKYKVWIQISDQNTSGPTKYCTFLKGPVPISGLAYPNSGNFTNMVLSWTPSAISTNNLTTVDNPLSVYPNPAHEKVNIYFSLKNDKPATVAVYDIKGQLVKYIIKNTLADTGLNTLVWDGTNENNTKVPKGTYFIKVMCSEYEKIVKVVLL